MTSTAASKEIREFKSIITLFRIVGHDNLSLDCLLAMYISNKLGRPSGGIRIDTFRRQISKWNQVYSKTRCSDDTDLPCVDVKCLLKTPHRVCSDKQQLRWVRPEMYDLLYKTSPTSYNPAADQLERRLRLARTTLARLEKELVDLQSEQVLVQCE